MAQQRTRKRLGVTCSPNKSETQVVRGSVSFFHESEASKDPSDFVDRSSWQLTTGIDVRVAYLDGIAQRGSSSRLRTPSRRLQKGTTVG